MWLEAKKERGITVQFYVIFWDIHAGFTAILLLLDVVVTAARGAQSYM